jgi:hypothetical protein
LFKYFGPPLDIGEKFNSLRAGYSWRKELKGMGVLMRLKKGGHQIGGLKFKVKGEIRKSIKAKILTAGIRTWNEGKKSE